MRLITQHKVMAIVAAARNNSPSRTTRNGPEEEEAMDQGGVGASLNQTAHVMTIYNATSNKAVLTTDLFLDCSYPRLRRPHRSLRFSPVYYGPTCKGLDLVAPLFHLLLTHLRAHALLLFPLLLL
jgi:hypothetical protein